MPFGATTPRQLSSSTSSPLSASVGTSGSVGARCALETANARICPDVICGSSSETPEIAMVARPDSAVLSSSPPPECAT